MGKQPIFHHVGEKIISKKIYIIKAFFKLSFGIKNFRSGFSANGFLFRQNVIQIRNNFCELDQNYLFLPFTPIFNLFSKNLLPFRDRLPIASLHKSDLPKSSFRGQIPHKIYFQAAWIFAICFSADDSERLLFRAKNRTDTLSPKQKKKTAVQLVYDSPLCLFSTIFFRVFIEIS